MIEGFFLGTFRNNYWELHIQVIVVEYHNYTITKKLPKKLPKIIPKSYQKVTKTFNQKSYQKI